MIKVNKSNKNTFENIPKRLNQAEERISGMKIEQRKYDHQTATKKI
jgi:hypothetical protein